MNNSQRAVTRTLEQTLAVEACRQPLRLEPIPVARVWGGERLLSEIHPRLRLADGDTSPIGETWEVSDVGDDPVLHSRIRGGEAHGATLRELLRQAPEAFLGQDYLGDACAPTLPLLYKFIDARQNLSVQVHPSDELLAEIGQGGRGKSEAWVVLDARPGAEIIFGLESGVTVEEFMERARYRHGVEGLQRVPVERGDVVHLPAGTIHAIGAGILLAEIQQSSDVTYRIHDWGRLGLDGRPRELHLEQAARVRPPEQIPPCPLPQPGLTGPCVRRISGRYFTLDEIHLDGEQLALPPQGNRLAILSVLDGQATLRGPGIPGDGAITADDTSVSLGTGDTVLLPALCQECHLVASGPLWALWMQPAD